MARDEIEDRIRADFPPERWYDLLVRVAAHVELVDRAVERRASEEVALGTRLARLESRCPRIEPAESPPCEAPQ